MTQRLIKVLLENNLDTRKRVVKVKSGNDFVDLLRGFLTMPLGAIVRLLENYD